MSDNLWIVLLSENDEAALEEPESGTTVLSAALTKMQLAGMKMSMKCMAHMFLS